MKEHYKLLDAAAEAELNKDLKEENTSDLGDKDLAEYLFDQNTGKAVHYTRATRDFVLAQDAENTRRGIFHK